jgi:hypothetical protein
LFRLLVVLVLSPTGRYSYSYFVRIIAMYHYVPVRSIGPSRCCYRRRAIEYEYRTLMRPEYEYEYEDEKILFREG